MGIYTYPMFRRLVVRIADTIILSLQFVYPFRLALERDDLKIIDIEEAEHVPAYVEHQHSVTVLELEERKLFLHIRA